ncbi:MAG TPA: SRPBCC domain-containing protein [Burkholderiales bacterium]|nr:SRPBCC domain-containing protein [Burkholderiales bacterium]
MEKVGDETSLALVRKFKASPQAVWRALTQPDALKQWMAPSADFEILVAETDVRVGGRYHIVMKSPDGEEHDVSGVYREVTVNTKLVYTWAWKSTPERESLVTIELSPAGDGTEFLLKHERFADEEARERHEQGWTGCIRRLARLFA